MTDCIWRGTQQPRALRKRHEEGCEDETCHGCQPCTEPHCLVCGIEHKLGVCPSCLGAARDDLWELVRLLSRVTNEMHKRAKVQKHGVLESVPGGELMYLAGPTADLAYHAARSTLALHRGQDHVSDEHDSDGEHPTLMLAWWEDKWRTLRGQLTDVLVVYGDVSYLDDALTWAGDNEPHFPEFAKGLRQQVTRVEDALLEGIRPDIGAPCLQCGRRQIKKLGATEAKDRWECAHCKVDSSPAQYMLSEADERRMRAMRLTASDIELRFGVKRGTLWKWASDGDVAKRGMNGNGHKMYDVADVQRMVTRKDDDEGDSAAEVS